MNVSKDVTHKDYWSRVTTIDACLAALVVYKGNEAISALASQRLAELNQPKETPGSRLNNHIDGSHPQTATQILADLLADTGSQDTVNRIKGRFWELRPHDAPPAKGTDWTDENIADPKYANLLRRAILSIKFGSRRLPIALKNYFEGRSSLSRDDLLRHLRTLTGSEDLVNRIRGSFWEKGGRQSLPGGADWVDTNLANPDCRHTLREAILEIVPDVFTQITEEKRVPRPAPEGAKGAGAAAVVVSSTTPVPARGTPLDAFKPDSTPHPAIALKNHFEGRSSLSRDDLLRHLRTLTGSEDLVNRIRGSFWEKGGRQSLPGGADWVDTNLANPDCRHTLGEAILEIVPHVFTQITEEKRVPSHAPAGAGGGGAGAPAGVVAFSPPAPGRGTRLVAVGMVNEGGTDCYLVTAWQLLLNIPRLRNQILKHLLPRYTQDGLNVDLTGLKPLAGEHLRAKAAGTTTPLKGSSKIRPILTALGTTSSSERRIKDSGEIIYDLVKAMSRDSSFLPKFKITQHMPMGGGSFSIETPDSQGPLRISPSAGATFEATMSNSLGYHPNASLHPGDPIASTTQIIGPPPLDLFVSVNRRNLDPIRVDEAYRLPIEATTERGPSDYTLQGFAYWTGGHYISFYKNLDRTWTMVNDSVASTPSLDTLNFHRERASLIYYQRNDAPSLDTDEDNAWWRDPAPVVGTAGAGGECSIM